MDGVPMKSRSRSLSRYLKGHMKQTKPDAHRKHQFLIKIPSIEPWRVKKVFIKEKTCVIDVVVTVNSKLPSVIVSDDKEYHGGYTKATIEWLDSAGNTVRIADAFFKGYYSELNLDYSCSDALIESITLTDFHLAQSDII